MDIKLPKLVFEVWFNGDWNLWCCGWLRIRCRSEWAQVRKSTRKQFPPTRGVSKEITLCWRLLFSQMSYEGQAFCSLIWLLGGHFWRFLTSSTDLNICWRNTGVNEFLISNILLYIISTDIIYMYTHTHSPRENFDFFFRRVRMLREGCLLFYSLGLSFHLGFYILNCIPLSCLSHAPDTDLHTTSSLGLPWALGPPPRQCQACIIVALPSALLWWDLSANQRFA